MSLGYIGLLAFGNSPVSASHFTPEALRLQMCTKAFNFYNGSKGLNSGPCVYMGKCFTSLNMLLLNESVLLVLGSCTSCSQTYTYLHRKWGPPSSFKLPTSWSAGGELKPPHHGRSHKASETKIKNGGLHRRSAFLLGWKRRKGSHTAHSSHKCLSLQYNSKRSGGSWQLNSHIL